MKKYLHVYKESELYHIQINFENTCGENTPLKIKEEITEG